MQILLTLCPGKANLPHTELKVMTDTAQIKPPSGKHQSIFHMVLHFEIANFIVSEKIGTKWIETCFTLLELPQLITE